MDRDAAGAPDGCPWQATSAKRAGAGGAWPDRGRRQGWGGLARQRSSPSWFAHGRIRRGGANRRGRNGEDREARCSHYRTAAEVAGTRRIKAATAAATGGGHRTAKGYVQRKARGGEVKMCGSFSVRSLDFLETTNKFLTNTIRHCS